jgi:hypothetical protein
MRMGPTSPSEFQKRPFGYVSGGIELLARSLFAAMTRKWTGLIAERGDARHNGLVYSLRKAILLDMRAAQEMLLRRPMPSLAQIAYALGVSTPVIVAVHRGKHWQQDAEKVRIWNELHNAAIPEETGIPTEADLNKFGISTGDQRAKRQEALARQREAAKLRQARLRIEKKYAKEQGEVEINKALTRPIIKERPPLTLRLDTAYFQASIDEALWRLLRQLDDVKISAMNGRELAAAVATLLEKRALLRGEPTQIVRNDNRGSLEKIGEMLMAEMVRRGRKIPGMENPVLDVTPKTAAAG